MRKISLFINIYNNSITILLVPIVLCAILILCNRVASAELLVDQSDRILRVGLWKPIFAGFNPDDAIISTKVWIETWGVKSNLFDKAMTYLFDDTSVLREKLIDKEINVVIISAGDFFVLESENLLTPDFGTMRGDLAGDEYVLVVRKDNEYKELSDLKNKNVILSNAGYDKIGTVWLENLLYESGLDSTNKFFELVHTSNKPSQIVLSVFFGKMESCIIPRIEFETMVELNPQVGEKLSIIETSPRLIPLLIAFSTNYDPSKKQIVGKSAVDLHQDPTIKQILMLHRIGRVVKLTDSDLSNTRMLYQSYNNHIRK